MAFDFRTLKYLPGEMARAAAQKFAPFTPGKELATGLMYSTLLPSVKRAEQKALDRQKKLADKIVESMRDAAKQGDTKRIERLKTAASYLESPKIIESVMKDAPTTKQVAASAGELALFAALGYKPYLQTGKLAMGAKATIAGKVYKAGT